MNRLTLCSTLSILFLLSNTASATIVDLIDPPGTLDWDTSQSVTLPSPNTVVTHPLFANNRHTYEGWFLYVEDTGELDPYNHVLRQKARERRVGREVPVERVKRSGAGRRVELGVEDQDWVRGAVEQERADPV